MLFDNAHAGELYVGERYAVNLKRWVRQNGSWVYNDHDDRILDAVSPALDGVFVERLRAEDPGPSVPSLAGRCASSHGWEKLHCHSVATTG